MRISKVIIMKSKRITSRQVAKKAGVSQTTVSFVLNDLASANNISNETAQRVLNAAQELGYVPNVAARTLARGRSANIGLILAQPHEQVFIDEYIPSILSGLSRITRQHGYRILFELIQDDSHADAYINLIRGKEVAGMIVNLNEPDYGDQRRPMTREKLIAYVAEGFPIVSLDYIHPTVHSVMVDKLSGVRRIIEHLINLGHRRIACITYAPKKHNHHAEQRLQIYQEMLEQVRVPFDEELVRFGAYDPETGYTAMKSLLELRPLPTALYAMNDVMAFGAMTAIREAGLRVPEDMAVVGFDDVRLARYTTPALTTVYEPDIEHGYRAGEMLIKLIQEQPLEQAHIVLETQLRIRDSCGWRLAHGNRSPQVSAAGQ